MWISGMRVVFSFLILLFMSPMSLGYKELGLNLLEHLQDPLKHQWPAMGEENKNEGVGYPINILLDEALEKQRNMMMDEFS